MNLHPWVRLPVVLLSVRSLGLSRAFPLLSVSLLLCSLPTPSVSGLGSTVFLAAVVDNWYLVEGVMAPRNAADSQRADLRASRPELQTGRPVLPSTTLNRDALYDSFLRWCRGIGVDFNSLLLHAMQNLDEVNAILSRFGRELYRSGRPYGHYAETINAVAGRRPAIRRHLQQCWDLAYAWVKQEPRVHHTAMPFQVLLACLSTALMWGWLRFAGTLALTWGGVMRIGEALKARRADLLLPQDFGSDNPLVLLSIDEAKMRCCGTSNCKVRYP